MVNVHDYAHNLARALKDSPENKAYQAAKSRVKGNSAAESMITDFHKKQLELQSLVMQGKEPSAEQRTALEGLFSVIQTSPDARDYIMAEQRLGTMLNDIYKIIGEAVNIELPGAQ